MIATDLSIGRNDDWSRAQDAGSQGIIIWESDDLINWSKERMVTLTQNINAGCTWAPEAYYDEITGEYVVFWASKVEKDNFGLQRIYYSKTRDFVNFTEPEIWIDRKTASTIDTTIIAGKDGFLYRISKNEGNAILPDGNKVHGSTVYMEKSTSLFGNWTKVKSDSLEKISGVEGPTCYKFNKDDSEQDKWCLLLDHFGANGYTPYVTENINSKGEEVEFKVPSQYSLPSAPRHGTVLPITKNEYKEILKKYANSTEENDNENHLEALEAKYSFFDQNNYENESVIQDESGNKNNAKIVGNGAKFENNSLYLPGGNANSKAAYVELPGNLFSQKDNLTISLWLKNDTGAGNYSAMSFGTPTKFFGNGTNDNPTNYWLLNPCDPSGNVKSVWTNGNNSSSPWTTETPSSSTKSDNEWNMYTTVISKNKIMTYYNGKLISTASKTVTTKDFGNEIVASIGRSGYNDKFFKGNVSNVSIYSSKLSNDEIVQLYLDESLEKAKDSLELNTTGKIKEDITLPTEGKFGSKIQWKSNNENIISNAGKVTRPKEDKNYEVILTAEITLNNKTITKDFKLTVEGASIDTLFKEAVDNFSIPKAIRDKINLPTSLDLENTIITYKSNKENIISNSGNVNQPSKDKDDEIVKLTATISYKGNDTLKVQKDFEVIVHGKDYGYLLSYSTENENSVLGNSLHLAYSIDGIKYKALNSNTGICFANNQGGAKNSNPNSLSNFKLFTRSNGLYGLCALDASRKKNQIYIYESDDLVNFKNEIKLKTSKTPTEIQNVYYYFSTNTYVIIYKSGNENIKLTTNNFKNIVNEEAVDSFDIDTKGKDLLEKIQQYPEGVSNKTATNVFVISKSELFRITNKLDKITNDSIDPVEIEVDDIEDIDELNQTLPKKVKANYSDGGKSDFNVEWDLSNINQTNEQTYELIGEIKQEQYANPLIPQRADPCILKGDDGYYYFTVSYPMKGGSDKNGYDKITLRRSKTISGLSTAEEITIWDCDDSKDEFRYVWAPEIHVINGIYYIYYTSSDSKSSVWGIRPHVLKCNNSEKILEPSSWEAMGKVVPVKDDDIAFSNFSLDMTIFENNGRQYIMWAQTDGYSSLFIAEVDDKEPWKCISKCTKISIPEYSWERINENVNEGPSILKHDGKIFCTFSAAGTGSEYCLGLLTADANSDLLDKNSWVKQSYPILTSKDVEGEYGPGHNSFTVDENGNDIFVYHARGQECFEGKCKWASDGSLYDPCRDARVKRVHWSSDGTPILNMTNDQELKTTKVKAKITVKKQDTTGIQACLVTINNYKLSLAVNQTFELKAKIVPFFAKNKTIKFTSSNKKIASVDKNGIITGLSEGYANIIATAANGKKAVCKVTIVKEKINFSKKILNVKHGKTIQLSPTVSPSNTKVTYSCSNNKIASVSEDGKITGKKIGIVTITGTTSTGQKSFCTVIIY